MTFKEQDWNEERGYLETVITQIQERLQQSQVVVQQYKRDTVTARKHFWDEITIDPNEVMETAVNILQQSRLVATEERSLQLAQQSLHKLERMLPSPYFGRIDFSEGGVTDPERIYIGILSLIDQQSDQIWIYDWRTPIAGMFYDVTLGSSGYKAPGGVINGEITLKRQYLIEDGQIESMFDTGLHIGDGLLQQMLGKSADDRMKSIVTTIQREQNQIIRDDKHQMLIVQGAAGSGKTSAALQRVAYLLYKYRSSLSEDNMILFSPNAMFNDYVSTVLPELGENNVQQSTFQEYVEHRLGSDYVMEDRYTQLESLLTANKDVDHIGKIAGIEYKASLDFLKVIDNYVAMLGEEGVIFKNLTIGSKLVVPKEKLVQLFYEKTHWSFGNRIDTVKEWILKELNDQEKVETKHRHEQLLNNTKYIGTDKELKVISINKARKKFASLKESVKKLAFIDVLEMYCKIFTDENLFEKMAQGTNIPDEWEKIKEDTQTRLATGLISYEEITPLLYLKEALEGTTPFNSIKHVIIDEAQDYSPFQYHFLRKMFPRSRMTVLGDLNQAIYTYSNLQDYSTIENLYGKEHTAMIRLSKSYRSTSEIVDFTKAMLPFGEAIEPFRRSGDKPQVIHVLAEDMLAMEIAKRIRIMQDKGAKSIAIMGKTAAESQQAYEKLSELTDLHLITKHTSTFATGTLVIPSYLAKGLEFDGVIVYNASKELYERRSERKLFYTACTRALHHLHICYTGELTPFIAELDSGLVEMANSTIDSET